MTLQGLFRHTRPHLGSLGLGALCLSSASALTLLSPELIGLAVAALPVFTVDVWLRLGLLLLGRSILGYWGLLTLGRMTARVTIDLRQSLFSRFVLASTTFHDRSWSADLVSALTTDAAFIYQSLARLLPALVLHTPVAIVATVLLFAENWQLALSVAVGGLPAFVLALAAGASMRRLTREGQRILGQMALVAQETFQDLRLIKALTREDFFIRRFSHLAERHLGLKYKGVLWGTALEALMPIAAGGGLGALWIAAHQLEAGKTTLADLIVFGGYLTILASSLLGVAKGYITLEHVAGAVQRLAAIDRSGQENEKRVGQVIPRGRGELMLESVSFSYPGARGGLDEISLRIAPGEIVSLVGPNGAGKSTLVHLLLRLYEPTAGCIRLDGRAARAVDVDAWRRHFALVTRDPAIFSVTAGENIGLGRLGAGRDEIVAAARSVNLHHFLDALPNGYDSLVGEQGIHLSAGQRQRLALARVFLQNPAIIIFDEATTSLDEESKHALVEAVRKWSGHRTLIFVSHDRQSLWPATKLVHIEAGRLVQVKQLS